LARLFSSIGAYNRDTTLQLIICHFAKNAYLISALLAVGYEKVEKCATDSMTAAYKWSPAVRLQRRLRIMVRLCVGAGRIAIRPDAEKESLNEKGLPNGMV